MTVEIAIFCNMTPCILVEIYRPLKRQSVLTFLWNIGRFIPDLTASHYRRGCCLIWSCRRRFLWSSSSSLSSSSTAAAWQPWVVLGSSIVYLRFFRSSVLRMQFLTPPFASSSVTKPYRHSFGSLVRMWSQDSGNWRRLVLAASSILVTCTSHLFVAAFIMIAIGGDCYHAYT